MSDQADPQTYQCLLKFSDSAEDIKKVVQAHSDQKRRVMHSVADIARKGTEPSYDNIVLPFITTLDNEDQFQALSTKMHIYCQLHPDKDTRKAANAARKSLKDVKLEMTGNQVLFDLVSSLWAREKTETNLNSPKLAKLEKLYKRFLKTGMGVLTGSMREDYIRNVRKIDDLVTEFEENNRQPGAIWFSQDDLEGLTTDDVKKLEKGTGQNDGKFRLTYGQIHRDSIFNFARRPQTRETFYKGWINSQARNAEIFKELVTLRQTCAHMRGHKHQFDVVHQDLTLLKTQEQVRNYLEDLKKNLASQVRVEREKLLGAKRKDLGDNEEMLYLWDRSYYTRILRENEYNVEHHRISELFPLQHTLTSLLATFSQMFGLRIDKIDTSFEHHQPHLWHDSINIFAAWDSDDGKTRGGFKGYLYLDLMDRDGKHKGGRCLYPLRGHLTANGSRVYAVSVVTMNFEEGVGDRPTLLSHKSLVTLFHELGHGFHNLLMDPRASGGVAGDFSEVPSQMLENWCWDKRFLLRIAKHYADTGCPADGDEPTQYEGNTSEPSKRLENLVEQQIRSKELNKAIDASLQLCIALFDLQIQTTESPATLDSLMPLESLWNKSVKEACHFDGPEVQPESRDSWDWGHYYALFPNLVKSKAGSYYKYAYGHMLATDMYYTKFLKNPWDPEVCREYRKKILEPESKRDPLKLLTNFLGREPNQEALRCELGQSKSIM